MRVTLKDIAEKVGVTKTAVSLAMRDCPGISEALREKIRRVADEVGYLADPILQRLAEYRRTGGTEKFQSVIAWVNHWEQPEQLRRYHEFEQYWRGAKATAKRMGYRLEEFVWPTDCPAKRAEALLQARGALGLLIPPHKPEVDWRDFDCSKFSLIRFGLSVHQLDCNLVTSDHQRAMIMAVNKIYDLGYRPLGLVYDAAHDTAMGGNLYGGFLAASQAVVPMSLIPPLDIDVQHLRFADKKKKIKAWMTQNQPDAVLTSVPELPVILRQLGYRIPEDVAVAGTTLADISVDTGIDQCPAAIGQIAAEMLIKQVSLNERGEPADPCRILIESRWRDGESMPPRR